MSVRSGSSESIELSSPLTVEIEVSGLMGTHERFGSIDLVIRID